MQEARSIALSKHEAQETTYRQLETLYPPLTVAEIEAAKAAIAAKQPAMEEYSGEEFGRRIRRRSSETRRRTGRGVGEGGSNSAMGNVDDPTRRVGIGSNNELSAGASQQLPDWLEISVESALHEFWQYRRDIRSLLVETIEDIEWGQARRNVWGSRFRLRSPSNGVTFEVR